MTIQQLFEMIVQDREPIALIVLIAMTIIQVTPIKLNPWSAIFKWIGKQINKEVVEKIDVIEKRLDDHIENSTEAELKVRRMAILDFSSAILRRTNYHREKFDFMIKECDSYEAYCTENNIKNGVAEASIAEIRRVYQEHLRNSDFLVEQKPSAD